MIVPEPRAPLLYAALVAGLPLGACGDREASPVDLTDDPDAPGFAADCSLPADEIADTGVGRDGIPALTNPTFVPPDDLHAGYLRDDDRVIGVVAGDRTLAIAHNILWWHEIVNLDLDGGEALAVTYCPLTGSSLVLDRGAVDGAEFGVSGLLFMNNLMMYDRRAGRSLWPQMRREAGCGRADGTELEMYPAMEMTWEGWREIHPDTEVVQGTTGAGAGGKYQTYPYGDYEELHNEDLVVSMEIDDRRPPKERVLGIPGDSYEDAVAFPFLELDSGSRVRAVSATMDGEPIVVFWDGRVEGVMAFEPRAGDRELTFTEEDDAIVDDQTGTEWRVDGRAIQGELEGVKLPPVVEAHTAFWFAWAAFHPETRIWESGT